MAALKDLTGQQFGDFKVISRAPKNSSKICTHVKACL